MRKPVPFLLLAALLLVRPAAADPLRITSGAFALDIEGDMFVFRGSGFTLATTDILIDSTKEFRPQCFFCATGELIDWSFTTTGGEQLLGRGEAVLDGITASNVDFVGSMRFNATPSPLPAGDGLNVDFVAPFSFEAIIRGLQGGEEIFARQFIGSGLVRVDYELSSRPGFFVEDDDTVLYEFATPVPEPATLLLLGSGLAAGLVRARRRRAGAVPPPI